MLLVLLLWRALTNAHSTGMATCHHISQLVYRLLISYFPVRVQSSFWDHQVFMSRHCVFIADILLTSNRDPAGGAPAHWRCAVGWGSTFCGNDDPHAKCLGSAHLQIHIQTSSSVREKKREKTMLTICLLPGCCISPVFAYTVLRRPVRGDCLSEFIERARGIKLLQET